MPRQITIQTSRNIWAIVGRQTNCFHSKFELFVAVYYELLKKSGYIKDWQYEPRKFLFYGSDIPKRFKGKESGVRNYTPDFLITNPDESTYWVETKGYMDSRSFTKISCFFKYYPDETIKVLMQRYPKPKNVKAFNTCRKLEQMGIDVKNFSDNIKKIKSLVCSMATLIEKPVKDKSNGKKTKA